MADRSKTPGVYVEEISLLPTSIDPVATAVPAFIGYTRKAVDQGRDLRMRPTQIRSLTEFHESFGTGPDPSIDPPGRFSLHDSIRLYFANGGGRCYIVSVGDCVGEMKAADLIAGLESVAGEDEPTMLACPDATGIGSSEFYDVQLAALRQCGRRRDRVAILDLLERKDGAELSLQESVEDFRSRIGTRDLGFGAAYVPHLRSTLSPADEAQTLLPPSGVIAGIYCRVDRTRGVYKAPANVSLSNVEVGRVISEEQQDWLIVDPVGGKSINAIRSFAGRGTLVWGARTLDGDSNEWRYVNVRRFANMVEESVKKATEPFVFEPNDRQTWAKVRGMIESFLLVHWRSGALQGAKPEQAFFVRVGLGETMTRLDIDEGRMIVEIGMAVVRPAEFIILRFSHKMPES